jgi:hypothetical protein
MWQRYFPNAMVYGLDIYEKRLGLGSRIVTIKGSQSDVEVLGELAARYGPFDLIVDDGSHIGSDQQVSFRALFDAVKPGGFYVIEDVRTSYWPDWGGGPPGLPGTAVALVKTLVDSVNVGPLAISAIHNYCNIVFIQKAAQPAQLPAQLPRPVDDRVNSPD